MAAKLEELVRFVESEPGSPEAQRLAARLEPLANNITSWADTLPGDAHRQAAEKELLKDLDQLYSSYEEFLPSRPL